MVNKRPLLTKFLLLALLVLVSQTREVRADNSVENFVQDELQFGQGLGFPSIMSFHGDSAHDILVLSTLCFSNYDVA
jgi:1,2-dihydroxy-3-keto-5-methylthiopentene dioxygenase